MRFFFLLFFLFFSVRSAAQVAQDDKPSLLLYPEVYEVIHLINTVESQKLIAEILGDSKQVLWKALENEIILIKVHASHKDSKKPDEKLESWLNQFIEFTILSNKNYGREYLPQAYAWCLNKP
ncbi:hypothetical protein [Cecembia sp.]|uniref:hypothetical protein n=1 Tax=Cecembia sp. TaxID=1898110 RepID=UPI0025C28A64|nr:hypothetical protein [Cecembia sp.]